MSPNPFGRAIRDYYVGEQTEPLVDRDGAETREHSIETWYFGDHTPDAWRDGWLDGPLLDMGAGVGRDALYYQDQFETIAIEVSDHLVETMRDRGVRTARRADMFDLTATFERDRFQSAHAIGTQVGLVGSMASVRAFLSDLATVTTPDATAVFDNYAPSVATPENTFAYREDPAPGLGWRVYHEAYEGTVGETLVFRIFSTDRLREAVVGTPWTVAETRQQNDQWRAALRKKAEPTTG